MTQTNKIRVAVLFGGRSAEHEVSLKSAMNVIQYLDSSKFDVIPMGIDKLGNWFMGKDVLTKSLENNNVPKLQADNHAWFAPEWIGKSMPKQTIKELLPNKLSGCYFDVVFPVVHGTLCEDGTLQGLLELADVPYVGCGVLSSAIGMDKDVSKRLAMNADILVAPYVVIRHAEWLKQPEKTIKRIVDQLSYPVFIKPSNAGSSIGVSKAKTPEQLTQALNDAFKLDVKVVVEKALNVLEIEVAVLESLEPGADPIISVAGEIKPRHEFYSYEAKYLDAEGAELCIPATVSAEIGEAAREMAKKIFMVLECEGMARVDLFYDLDSKQLYFNEVNTIPGFTQISMYPKLMAASGFSYPDLLTHLVQLALQRHQQKSQLLRSYVA